jgi:hypothetical protein
MKTWNPDDSRWKTKWEELRPLAKHQAGKHDQKTHGRKGGGGVSDEYISGLPEDKKQILRDYIANPSVNDVLRNPEAHDSSRYDSEWEKAKQMDRVFSEAPKLEESITVYRAVSTEFASRVRRESRGASDEDELEYPDLGYTSTTLSRGVAANPIFSAGEASEIIQIEIPKGERVLSLEPLRSAMFPLNYNEDEILLRRNGILFFNAEKSDSTGVLTFEYGR